MGNAYCCISFQKKDDMVTQSEIMVESIENLNEKEIKDNVNMNLNIKNQLYIEKTAKEVSPHTDEDIDFENPLPKIVVIKRKKINN